MPTNKRISQRTHTCIDTRIARELFACAARSGNSEHKRAHFIDLPALVLAQARAIAQGTYQPQPLTVFAVTDPKLREIFAPAFADRLVHQWLVAHIEPWWNRRFIDDSFANRKAKGTQAAIARLQHFMRQPAHRWYCKLDIQAFFPSIDRAILRQIWSNNVQRLPYDAPTRARLNQVALAIFEQNPIDPAPTVSGQKHLLARVPAHKSLFHTATGKGLPIGSLSSQFFANVYLNELDQFIKHTLKVRGYVRYVDDFVLLGDNPAVLNAQRKAIDHFLHTSLALQVHPHKTVMQRCTQGIDFLGSIVYPHHTLVRQRSVRALKLRVQAFTQLVFGGEGALEQAQFKHGSWQRWLANHQATLGPGIPTAALLQKMLSTLNSYYGMFTHAHTWHLRKHIYEVELGALRQFFLPDGPRYSHLRIRKVWQSAPTL